MKTDPFKNDQASKSTAPNHISGAHAPPEPPPPYMEGQQPASEEQADLKTLKGMCDAMTSALTKTYLADPVEQTSFHQGQEGLDDLLRAVRSNNIDDSEAAHAHPEYTSDERHQEIGVLLAFDKTLTPPEFPEIPTRVEERNYEELNALEREWSHQTGREAVRIIHEAVQPLIQTLQSTDNEQAARDAAGDIHELIQMIKSLDTANQWTAANEALEELEQMVDSIRDNISKRRTHLADGKDVESIDEDITREIRELRSTVSAQLSQIAESFKLLRAADKSTDDRKEQVRLKRNPCFQTKLGVVCEEIQACKGQRTTALLKYERNIEEHKELLLAKKKSHLDSLTEHQTNLQSEQESIVRALRTLLDQYVANTARKNVVATKIAEATQSKHQVQADWQDAQESIKAPAKRVADRLADLEAHKSIMSQVEELNGRVMKQIECIATERESFLQNARTQIVLQQFDAITTAYSQQYKSLSKVKKRACKEHDELVDLEFKYGEAENMDDVKEMKRIAEKTREHEAQHQEAVAEMLERQDQLEQTDNVLRSVVITAAEAADRHDLLTCPVFYSDNEAPMQFDLDGKTIVHPRVTLMIEEIEKATIEADKKQARLEAKLATESKQIESDKSMLQKLKLFMLG